MYGVEIADIMGAGLGEPVDWGACYSDCALQCEWRVVRFAVRGLIEFRVWWRTVSRAVSPRSNGRNG